MSKNARNTKVFGGKTVDPADFFGSEDLHGKEWLEKKEPEWQKWGHSSRGLWLKSAERNLMSPIV